MADENELKLKLAQEYSDAVVAEIQSIRAGERDYSPGYGNETKKAFTAGWDACAAGHPRIVELEYRLQYAEEALRKYAAMDIGALARQTLADSSSPPPIKEVEIVPRGTPWRLLGSRK